LISGTDSESYLFSRAVFNFSTSDVNCDIFSICTSMRPLISRR
jgi:hypothetical protein